MLRSSTRRQFLTSSLAASVILPQMGRSATAQSSSYWQAIRWMFPFREERIPMNAANLCPSPRIVIEQLAHWTQDIDADCSFNNRAKYAELREQARSLIAAQLRVDPDEIALVRNTSEANNIINNGFPLKQDDEVVVWTQNHPTNLVAWKVRAQRFGLRVREVSTPATPRSRSDLIEPFQDAFTDRTRLLTVSHLSNVSGLRLPVKELAEVAHRRGIYLHVDGAQTWGAFDLNLRELGCDSFAASAHKWFMGPKEAGLLFVSQAWISKIWPSVVAPGWGDDPEPDVEGARKFESLGQRDDARLAALGVAGEFLNRIGIAAVEERIRDLSNRLKSGLSGMGARLVTPQEAEFSGGICILQVPSDKRRELLNRLYEEHGIAGAPTGGLRLCPHIYNTEEHVDRTLRAVSDLRTLWQA